MAKIHVDCEDAILACEKAIETQNRSYKESLERIKKDYPVSNTDDSRLIARHQLDLRAGEETDKIKNLMHGAAYLKYKNRRLILDTQSEEFALISNFLPTE